MSPRAILSMNNIILSDTGHFLIIWLGVAGILFYQWEQGHERLDCRISHKSMQFFATIPENGPYIMYTRG
jgi:hypothetical protein